MNHLTAQELFELSDNRLENGMERRLEAHLAACDRCRRAVALERSMRNVVKNAPIVKAPEGLSALIMVNLSARANDSLMLRLLGKLGSFVAMAMVLAVIGLVIVLVSELKVEPAVSYSSFTDTVAPLTEMYTKGVKTFNHGALTITQAIDSRTGTRFWNTIFVVLITFGVLGAADKIFAKWLTKLRL